MNYLEKLYNLKGKVAVITGGAGTLGAVYADALASVGAVPILADTNGERAQKIAQDLEKKYGVPARGYAVDVTRAEDLKKCADAVLKEHGRVDILVNNAGIGGRAGDGTTAPSFEDYPRAEFERTLAVNLTGMVLAAQVFGRAMLAAGRGAIVNVSSIYGILSPDQRMYEKEGAAEQFIKPVSYAVSKSAVLNLTRYLATLWAPKGIRVNTLTPGGVFDGHDSAFVKKYADRTPLARMAAPEDLAGPLLFLVSDASAYMTGANLIVDGGWSAW